MVGVWNKGEQGRGRMPFWFYAIVGIWKSMEEEGRKMKEYRKRMRIYLPRNSWLAVCVTVREERLPGA